MKNNGNFHTLLMKMQNATAACKQFDSLLKVIFLASKIAQGIEQRCFLLVIGLSSVPKHKDSKSGLIKKKSK